MRDEDTVIVSGGLSYLIRLEFVGIGFCQRFIVRRFLDSSFW